MNQQLAYGAIFVPEVGCADETGAVALSRRAGYCSSVAVSALALTLAGAGAARAEMITAGATGENALSGSDATTPSEPVGGTTDGNMSIQLVP